MSHLTDPIRGRCLWWTQKSSRCKRYNGYGFGGLYCRSHADALERHNLIEAEKEAARETYLAWYHLVMAWAEAQGATEREMKILRMRSESKTLEEVGNELGNTRERIRQIEAKWTRGYKAYEGGDK